MFCGESRRAVSASRAARTPQRSETEISSMHAVKLATYMTRNGLIGICSFALLIGGADLAHGLDPSKRQTQYRHSMWASSRRLPAEQSVLRITSVSTDTFGFDGVRLMPWSSPAVTSNRIRHFFPSKSGGFWISNRRGLRRTVMLNDARDSKDFFSLTTVQLLLTPS